MIFIHFALLFFVFLNQIVSIEIPNNWNFLLEIIRNKQLLTLIETEVAVLLINKIPKNQLNQPYDLYFYFFIKREGDSVIIWAAKNGYLEITDALIKNEADVNSKNK